MREYGYSAAAKDALYRLARSDVFVRHTQAVDVFFHRFLFRFGVSVFYHKVCDMRFPGAFDGVKRVEFIFREREAEGFIEKRNTLPDLVEPLAAPFFNDAAKNLRSRVEAVSEYVIFAEAVTAGEFYTGQKIRIRAGKYPGYADAAAERVVIGHRKQTDAGVPDARKKRVGRVGPVRRIRMHMKINDPGDSLHNR